MVAGTMITRTMLESSITPSASPRPSSFKTTVLLTTNDPKVRMRISPAAVMIPAVCWRPAATASSLLPVSWKYSLTRASMKTS